ncbi:hypothetical protein Ga0466249_005306 [Sporomusaceae bacterium BoRhaA]|uniref:hypothetical protein n=1 Tax=Pelorhabdus rhamnosifermentans TaxID=2772457 RepID=UPI001C063CA9|nr:hypothetical protein [Pelorhabdus rhamnosifermentans]MBU2704152.1 hypothetical protein [Pelorhabdus rhamnosifermentans]
MANLISEINVCPEAITMSGQYLHISAETAIDPTVIVPANIHIERCGVDEVRVNNNSKIKNGKLKVIMAEKHENGKKIIEINVEDDK